MSKFTLDSKLKEIFKDPKAKVIYEEVFPGSLKDPQVRLAFGMTIKSIADFAPDRMTPEKLKELEDKLSTIE